MPCFLTTAALALGTVLALAIGPSGAHASPTPPPPPPIPPCSLNGVGSPCVCDVGWVGAQCGQLDLLPAPSLPHQVTPASATTASNAVANSTWGISVVGPDNAGTYHGYMTEIAHHCPLGDYGSASQVAHMTAPSPLGPWQRRGIALAGFAHNPQAVVAPNGSVLLFHIGKELAPGCLKQCGSGSGSSEDAGGDLRALLQLVVHLQQQILPAVVYWCRCEWC